MGGNRGGDGGDDGGDFIFLVDAYMQYAMPEIKVKKTLLQLR